jgi:hypothetical protein
MMNLGFPAFDRRHFLKHLAGLSLMASPLGQFVGRLRAAAPQLKKDGKSLIILWMSGGPPTIDLWDMKYGAPTAFDDKPMQTSVSGIQISPYLPKVAAQMKHLTIVRSLSTTEGDHNRGTVLMHTGRSPNPVVQFPALGSMTAYSFRERTKDLALPSFISINGGRSGPGFLGMNYASFDIQNPGSPPQNLKPPASVGAGWDQVNRIHRRQRFFYTVEDNFSRSLVPYMPRDKKTGEVDPAERKKVPDATVAHAEVYGKAFNLVASDGGKVFGFSGSDNVQEYGTSAFGKGCLLARKLVEAGVTAVEVDLGGWDLHQNTQATLKNQRLPTLDIGMGTLVKDLVQRGLWDKTVVLWMGEFGRTPRINQNAGRDHWARCWSVVLGGGGLKGGQVYGSTSADGTEVKDKKCGVGDIFATVYQALGLDPMTDREVRDNLGRPFRRAPDGSEVLKALV